MNLSNEHLGVSENSVPLNPMVLLIIIPFLNGYNWEYIPIFRQTHLLVRFRGCRWYVSCLFTLRAWVRSKSRMDWKDVGAVCGTMRFIWFFRRFYLGILRWGNFISDPQVHFNIWLDVSYAPLGSGLTWLSCASMSICL